MKRTLAFSIALLLISAVWGQQFRSPSIRIQNLNQNEKPVRLSDLKIDVKVVGSLAVTTVDMTFFNPNNRVLEGELEFPLADGQNISRYALDINGKMREGVVVEKAKGQKTFESIVRRGIDPGLLEKTEGNNFRTRVYPLFANGSRRVIIAYEQELTPDNRNYRFFLPMQYSDVLDNFSLNLSVFANGEQPTVEKSMWGKFAFDKAGTSYTSSFSEKNYSANGQLVFSVPVKNDIQLYTEKGKISGQTVFYTQLFPDVTQSQKALPKRIALFWDASSSMDKRNFDMEASLFDTYFGKIGNLTVSLYPFNCKAGKVQTFNITNGNWDKLKTALQNIPYDGATQFGALDFTKVQADEILMFTDGLSNFGKRLPLLGKTPVTTVNSALSADYSMLKYISSTTGGVFINLMQQTTEEALTLLTTEALRLISADYNKKEIEGFTTSGNIIDPTKGLSIAGKLTGSKTSVTLNFGTGNQVSYTKTVSIDANNTVDYGNMVERLWAGKRIAELDLIYEQNKEEIEQLGRAYNIVTRNTSLIVLETLQDYITNRITPPEELLKDYNYYIEVEKENKKNDLENRISHVARMFEKRKAWWNERFPRRPVKIVNNPQPTPRPVQPAPRPTQPTVTRPAGAGDYTITGVIKEANGEPIIGATVTIRGVAGLGTVTNIDGEFSIKANNRDVLQFNYIGFNRREVSVTGNQTLEVVMEEDSKQLDEVVVVAFGAQRKQSIIGSVSTVDPADLRTPTGNISNALAGRAAGIIASQPGEDNTSELWIRGLSTNTVGSSALVIVDGVEVGTMDDVDINDIESFSILKDASSTAVYGSRGANGVVIITTKGNSGAADDSNSETLSNGIKVKTWESDAPYMEELKAKKNNELYQAYLSIKGEYKDTPSFYLDVATLFEERGLKEDAFLILSNLAELKLDDYRILRVLAHRLKQLDYNEYAITLFRKVLELRPEEPQSYRDLGLALAQHKEYQEAIDVMYKIIEQEWDNRFNEIEIFAVEEINNTISRAKREGKSIDISKIDERLLFNMPVDIRILLNWDTDNSDMDLWVTDPDGEKCYYKNQLTKLGGMISDDFTDGYGPEEFMIKKAKKGKYIIQSEYYGSREQTLVGPTTIYFDIYTHYGTAKETKKTITLRLTKDEDEVNIGEIVF